MKTFTVEGKDITIPDISVVEASIEGKSPVFQIMEGEHTGIQFAIENARVDDNDESLLWYDLHTEKDETVDKIKPIVDNFILSILYEQAERMRNAIDTASYPDA